MFCSNIFLLCTPLRYAISSTDKYDTRVLYPSQRESLCGRTQDILQLKRTKYQLSVYDKMPIVRIAFSCLPYISVQMVQCYRRFASKTINRLHTIATQIHTCNYRPHCDMFVPTLTLILRYPVVELHTRL